MSCSEGRPSWYGPPSVAPVWAICSNIPHSSRKGRKNENPWLPSGKCMKARCGDVKPSSSPYPFCLVMEMWHRGVSKYKPIDSVSVYVVGERQRLGGWQKKKWKGKEKLHREKENTQKEWEWETHKDERNTWSSSSGGNEIEAETDRERPNAIHNTSNSSCNAILIT